MPYKTTLLTIAALAAAACASRAKRDRAAADEETGKLYTSSSGWLNTSLEKKDIGEAPYGTHASYANPALRPTDPWVGSVGMKLGEIEGYDYGAGVALPGPRVAGQTLAATELEKVNSAALGLWLKLDF